MGKELITEGVKMFFELDDFFEFIVGMTGIVVAGVVAVLAINAFRPRGRKNTDKE